MTVTEERRQQWQNQLDTIEKAVEIGAITLNDWETEFIDSIGVEIYSGKELSFKQSSALRKIYNRIE